MGVGRGKRATQQKGSFQEKKSHKGVGERWSSKIKKASPVLLKKEAPIMANPSVKRGGIHYTVRMKIKDCGRGEK